MKRFSIAILILLLAACTTRTTWEPVSPLVSIGQPPTPLPTPPPIPTPTLAAEGPPSLLTAWRMTYYAEGSWPYVSYFSGPFDLAWGPGYMLEITGAPEWKAQLQRIVRLDPGIYTVVASANSTATISVNDVLLLSTGLGGDDAMFEVTNGGSHLFTVDYTYANTDTLPSLYMALDGP